MMLHNGILTSAVAFAAVSLAVPAAPAQELEITVTGSTRYDDNIRRTASSRQQFPHRGADIVSYLGVVGEYGTQIGSVDIEVFGNVGQNAFLWNDQFNTVDYGAVGTVRRTGARGAIEIEARHRRRPISFDEVTAILNAQQYFTEVTADASREVFGSFRLVGQADFRRSRTSMGSTRRNDNRAVGFRGGIGYYSPAGNYITVEYGERRSRGLLDSFVLVDGEPVAFRARDRQRSIVSRIKYAATAITSIKGSVGYTRHDDRSRLDADFTGLLADVTVTWSPSPALVISPTVRRSFGTESALYSSGVKVSAYSLNASGEIGARLRWAGYFTRENRDFRYDLRAPNPQSLARKETINQMGIGLSYETGSRFQVGLNYDRVRRKSNLPGFVFMNNAVTLSLSRAFTFGR